jgi:hypothetical protein
MCALFFFAVTAMSLTAGWLPRPVHTVRAYVYDYTREVGNLSLLKNGKLHKGIIYRAGVELSKEQVKRLQKALHSQEARTPGAFCYMPHHGFVFFDKDGKAMGHTEICFQCFNGESSPKGLPETEWDWKEIRKLIEELKIPILKKNENYPSLYRQEQTKRDELAKP